MEKALIIEDDKDIADLLTIHLSDLEFEADVSYDGKEGLLKALNNVYKIILLDILNCFKKERKFFKDLYFV